MSINLCFYTKAKKPRYINFPFQTPTSWTFEIFNESDVSKRIEILKQKQKDNEWLTNELVEECIEMLNDPDLDLSYI